MTLELPDGRRLIAGDGSGPKLGVRLSDWRAAAQLVFNPEVAFGELYTDGRLIMTSGSLPDLFDLLGRNNIGLAPPQIGHLRHRMREFLSSWRRSNSERAARRNVHHHYDIDDRIYSLFLDRDRQYSCAYFEFPGQDLEGAQLAKRRHIAAKLLVKSDMSVLDIGSGWGGLALYIADNCKANVTGLTLSSEQLKVAQGRADERKLSDRVKFRLQDYRALNESFDRIVSVGMFEHVGLRDYKVFFDILHRSLKPDGIALLHSIGRLDGKSPTNPWFEKYIFPGSYVPSLAEVLPFIETSGLVVADVEVLRLHYADTLRAWRERFMSRRNEAAAILGDRFCRMWEYYLAAGEAGFRYGGLIVFQIQLSRKLDAVPRTRDYIAAEEARLRAMEQKKPESHSIAAE